MKKGGGERYNMEEALVAQQYATDKEGKGFSEKASPESYAEAERVIGLLRDKKFDWLGIDWKKVDFKNIDADAESRIRAALETILESRKVKNAPPALVRKYMPLVFAASLLMAACEKKSPTQDEISEFESQHLITKASVENYAEQLEEARNDQSIQVDPILREINSARTRAVIKEYKDRYPQIQGIYVQYGGKREKTGSYIVKVRAHISARGDYNREKEYEEIRYHWEQEVRATEAVLTALREIVSEAGLNVPEGP